MTTPTPDQLADCDACGEPIAPGDVLHVPSEELGPDIERVHRACYDANRPGRKPVWLEAPTPDQLGEAAERATPEDTSLDDDPAATYRSGLATPFDRARADIRAEGARLLAVDPGRWDTSSALLMCRDGPLDVVAGASLLAQLRSVRGEDSAAPPTLPPVLDLEALANSEAVQAIIDLRLAQERVRMLEDCRRRLGWVSVVSSLGGLAAGAGLAQIVAWVAS